MSKNLFGRCTAVVAAAVLSVSAMSVAGPVSAAGENLLAGKPVTTSAADEFYLSNFPASRVTDGNTVSEPAMINWDVGEDIDNLAWYQIDLEDSQTINQVIIRLENAEWNHRPMDYAVDAFTAEGWVRVAERHMTDLEAEGSVYTLNFAPVEASKIRLTGNHVRAQLTDNTTNYRILEIEAYNNTELTEDDYTARDEAPNEESKIPELYEPVNVALGKSVTASAADEFYITNFPASRVTDGINDQQLSACINYGRDSANLAWYEIDLDGEVSINQVIIYLENAEWQYRSKDYAVDVLTAEGWVRVAERHFTDLEAEGSVYTLNFAPVEASKIRLTANNINAEDSTSAANYRVVEIEAYNNIKLTEDDYTAKDEAPNEESKIAMPVDRPTDPDDMVNIALNKPVTSSNTDAWLAENKPISRLTDGLKTDQPGPAVIDWYDGTFGWYEIDLGTAQEFNQIRLTFHGAEPELRPLDFVFDAYVDGEWVRVAEKHLKEQTAQVSEFVFRFATVKASKIRLTGSNINTPGGEAAPSFGVLEVEAFLNPTTKPVHYTPLDEAPNEESKIAMPVDLPTDPEDMVNIALNKPVTSSNTDAWLAENRPVSCLTDGLKEESPAVINWYDGTFGWYVIDLGTAQDLNQIRLTFFGAEPELRPLDFAFDAYVDGEWVRVAEKHLSVQTSLNSEFVFRFATVKASKIRLTGSNVNTPESELTGNFSVLEVEAFLNPTTKPVHYTPLDKAPDEYSILPLSLEADNLAKDQSVTTSNTDPYYDENAPAKHLTDGLTGENDTPAIINWYDGKFGWFQVNFSEKTTINNIKVIFHNAEWDMRPMDYAIDVYTDDGWKRVGEKHIDEWVSGYENFLFEDVDCYMIRITGNNVNAKVINNFRLAEVEAYKQPVVSPKKYTALDVAANDEEKIPLPADSDLGGADNPATGIVFPVVAVLLPMSCAALMFVLRKRSAKRS